MDDVVTIAVDAIIIGAHIIHSMQSLPVVAVVIHYENYLCADLHLYAMLSLSLLLLLLLL